VNEETTAKHWTFVKRAVNSERGFRNDVFVVNIGGDTDDAVRREKTRLFEIGPAEELQHGIRPIDMPIDRILVGEHALRESLADDNDRLFILLFWSLFWSFTFLVIEIERIEIAAGNDRNAKRRKESRRDGTPLRPGILYAGGMDVSVGGELQTRSGGAAGIAPGNDIAEGGLTHARQGINATYRFLVEIDDLLRRLPIRHSRNVDSQDVLRVQTRLRPLQCDQRSDQRTCAGQQHEGRGDLCHREDPLAAARAAGDPHTSAR
jgi:hypothetical protein